jgi:hypothetical protein
MIIDFFLFCEEGGQGSAGKDGSSELNGIDEREVSVVVESTSFETLAGSIFSS